MAEYDLDDQAQELELWLSMFNIDLVNFNVAKLFESILKVNDNEKISSS